jgi:ankyrin repeat protein
MSFFGIGKRLLYNDYEKFYSAIRRGDTDAIKVEIEKGADVNKKNEDGVPAFFLASENPEALQLLVDKGANLTLVDKNGDNILHYAIKDGAFRDYGEEGDLMAVGVVKYLIGKGMDVNQINNNKQTPLQIALRGNNFTLIKLLLDKGADENMLNERDRVLLQQKRENAANPKPPAAVPPSFDGELFLNEEKNYTLESPNSWPEKKNQIFINSGMEGTPMTEIVKKGAGKSRRRRHTIRRRIHSNKKSKTKRRKGKTTRRRGKM